MNADATLRAILSDEPQIVHKVLNHVVYDSVLDNLILTWRYARLSTDAPGWQNIGFLGLLVDFGSCAGGGRKGSRPPPLGIMAGVNRRDAIMVQKIVDKMPMEMKEPFEAYHIGVIRGDNCRALSHADRAIIIGLQRSTYYERVKKGRGFLRARVRC